MGRVRTSGSVVSHHDGTESKAVVIAEGRRGTGKDPKGRHNLLPSLLTGGT